MKSGALAYFTLYPNLSLVGLDDLLRDEKTQPHTRYHSSHTSSFKALKNTLLLFRVNSHSLIDNGNPDILFLTLKQ
jgi:hypothetical protein